MKKIQTFIFLIAVFCLNCTATTSVDETTIEKPTENSDSEPEDSSDNHSQDAPTDSTEDTNTSDGSDSNTTDDETTSEINPIPVGFWGMNSFFNLESFTDISNRFGINLVQTASSAPNYTITSLLPLAESTQTKLTLRLTDYVADGQVDFDLQAWTDDLLLWQERASEVIPYIENGTLVGHMILDDIVNFSGIDPTAEDLEAMACLSDSIFGDGLMTYVRERCDDVPILEGGYQCLDACVNQYTNFPDYSDGDVNVYAETVALAAEARGLKIINGLNICDGGDGRSLQPGFSNHHFAMSAEEILEYGAPLLDRERFPDLILFLMWEYDGSQLWYDGTTIGSDYFNQPNLQNAIFELSQMASGANSL